MTEIEIKGNIYNYFYSSHAKILVSTKVTYLSFTKKYRFATAAIRNITEGYPKAGF